MLDLKPPKVHTNGKDKSQPSSNGQKAKGKSKLDYSQSLDAIHWIFLIYSATHNTVNAFTHHDFMFFLFTFAGILTVELMLWTIYNAWKGAQLVGKMKKVGAICFVVAFFFASAGILANAQGGVGAGWVANYYLWVLPMSAPAMFILGYWLSQVDPIRKAQIENTAYAKLIASDDDRETLHLAKAKIKERANNRQLKELVLGKKLVALVREAHSQRVRNTLKKHATHEMPLLLKAMNVELKEKANTTFFSANYKALPAKSGGEDKSDTAKK